MHDGSLVTQITNRIEGLPVAVVMFPEQRGEVEVQFYVQFIHQTRDLGVAHDAEQEAPLHRRTVGIPEEQNSTHQGSAISFTCNMFKRSAIKRKK